MIPSVSRARFAGRGVRLIVLAMTISSFGGGMFLAGSTIFFTRSVGLTSLELGTGLAVAAVVGMLAPVPIGSLADATSVKWVLIGVSAWRSVWFVVLAFAAGPTGFLIAAAAQQIGQQATPALIQTLVADVTGSTGRVLAMALVRSARNFGFALGALAAGPLVASDSLWLGRLAMIGTGVAIAASALIMLRLPGRSEEPSQGSPQAARNPLAGLRSVGDWRYASMAAANSLLALHMSLLTVGFPLLVLSLPQVNPFLGPAVVFVNTILVVVAQLPFSRRVSNLATACRALWLAGISLAACCVLLAASSLAEEALTTACLVILAGLLLTMGELWQTVGSWEISYLLAPPQRRNSYLAIFSLSTGAQQALGPLILAGVITSAGAVGWLGLAGAFLLGALLTTALAQLQARQQTQVGTGVLEGTDDQHVDVD